METDNTKHTIFLKNPQQLRSIIKKYPRYFAFPTTVGKSSFFNVIKVKSI